MSETPAIAAEGLVKNYGKTKALAGFDLAVPPGTVYGLLGPNGAGKTTAVRVFATLLRPDGGRAQVLGHDVVTGAAEVRRHIGLTGQYAALDEYLTGRANLVMIGQLSRLTASAARRRADEMLERFGLTEAATRAVKTYSGGMRRRLDLAASLIGRPPILFLDEPTTGLDPRTRNGLWQFIEELVAEGTTVLLTTQYMEEAEHLADSIVVLDTECVVAQGTADQLKDQLGGDVLEIRVTDVADLERAATIVAEFGDVVPRLNPDLKEVSLPVKGSAKVLIAAGRALDDSGIALDDLGIRRPSLDDVFLSFTGHRTAAGEDADVGGGSAGGSDE